MKKLVSLIVPCRNEKDFIEKCLDSLSSQEEPEGGFEIIVVDGQSTDGTKEKVSEYIKSRPNIRLLENKNKTTPFAMNLGIKEAKGGIIMKIDAHTVYKRDYLKNCLYYMEKFQADNVGGVLKTVPTSDSLPAQAIAFCLSSPFGSGNSYFRTGAKEPVWQDTVAFGCYKKEVFEKAGFYNEKLARSQDMELNLRLKRAGLKTLLFPEIAGYYFAKANFKDFFIHNFRDGQWSTYPLKFVKIPFSLRHYIPFLFVSALGFSFLINTKLFFLILAFYFLTALIFSFEIAKREKNQLFLFFMPIAFFIRHFGYGAGAIWGIIKILF